MIESFRLRPFFSSPAAYSAGPNPLMLSDRVDGDRRIVHHSTLDDSPAAGMTAEEALENSAWWRAVNIIGSIVAQTPFHIKQVDTSTSGVKKTPAKDHAGYFATTHQSNPEDTAYEVRYSLATNSVMYGAGYAAIWRDAPGGLRIYPFETWEIRKQRIDGKLWYFRDVMPGIDADPVDKFRKFQAKDMIEVSGLKRNGLVAFATWWLAKNSIADGAESSKMRAARSKNSGRPALALTTEQALQQNTAEDIQKNFMRIHAGYEGVGKPAVLTHGLKPIPLPYAPDFQAEDALAKIPLREIANWSGVPSVLLGDTAGLAYEALEKLIEALFRFCIEHYWTKIEDQVRSKILSDEERREESHTAEFDRNAMAFMSAQDRAQMIRALGAGTPVDTPNGIRNWLGKPPLDDPEADKLQMPKNIGQDGQNNVPDSKSNDPGRPSAEIVQHAEHSCQEVTLRAMATAWDDTTRRMVRAGERASSNDVAYMAWCDSLDTDAEYIMLALDRCRSVGSLLGVNVDEARAAKGLTACKERLLEVAGAASKGKLHAVFNEQAPKLMILLPDIAAKAVLA